MSEQEPDLEDEWRAELVSMSPSEFAKFMLWCINSSLQPWE